VHRRLAILVRCVHVRALADQNLDFRDVGVGRSGVNKGSAKVIWVRLFGFGTIVYEYVDALGMTEFGSVM